MVVVAAPLPDAEPDAVPEPDAAPVAVAPVAAGLVVLALSSPQAAASRPNAASAAANFSQRVCFTFPPDSSAWRSC